MKVDKEVLDTLVSHLEDNLEDLNKEYIRGLERMKKAKTVEKVMQVKKEILLTVVRHIPLTNGECYFCILLDYDDESCEECPYAEYHGICDQDDDNDYSIIKDLKVELSDKINERYYCGEKYDKK